jgi:glycosyltransferase involved in cell wall biosynthesis
MSAPPRTILHVVATLAHGGTEVTCRDLAGELARRRGVANVVAVTGGSGSSGGPIEAELAAVSGRAVARLGRGRLARGWRFYRLCRGHRPAAVMLHLFGIDHVLLAAIARAAGVRARVVKAGNPPPADRRQRAIWRLLLVLGRLAGCRLVASSAATHAALRRLGPLPAGARVIHNACDIAEIRRRADTVRRSRTARAFSIGMVARLDPIKDHATLIAALAAVAAAWPDAPVALDIIGDGPLRPALEAQAAALGLADRVRVLGSRRDIPEQLGALDVLVLSTTAAEGFGIALIEALAAGVPVIASDVPACREVLRDGVLGTLVPPSDPAALAAVLTAHLQRWQAATAPALPDPGEVAAAYGLPAMADAYWQLLMPEADAADPA